MILQIAGTRAFNDYNLFYRTINQIKTPITEIVTGMAKGADMIGFEYATKHNISVKRFYPDWDKYGKSAGIKRNIEMVEYLSENNGKSLIFWDGKSRGTKNMIELCQRYNIVHYVVRYD